MSDNNERKEYMQDNRLDKHELKIEQIFATLDRMETVMERQAEAMKELSDSMIRIAASQETMTQLSVETKANSERLYIEEKKSALHGQDIDSIKQDMEQVKGDVKELNTTQAIHKIKLAGILSAASVVGGAIASFVLPVIF